MSYHDLLQLYFDRSNALQNYWTLYVVVIGGVLGVSSLRKQPDRIITVLISVLFICFAYKNQGAIVDVSLQRLAILDQIKTLPGTDMLRESLAPPGVDGVRLFHSVSGLLALSALWAMEWRRRRTSTVAASRGDI